jgi:hypothetical protein
MGREDEDGVKQFFHVDLDELVGELVYKDKSGKWHRLQVDLEPDRVRALVVSERYDTMDSPALSSKSDVLALDDLKDDASRPHVEMWAARGMWGVPLELGPKEKEPVVDPPPSRPAPRKPSK